MYWHNIFNLGQLHLNGIETKCVILIDLGAVVNSIWNPISRSHRFILLVSEATWMPLFHSGI